MKNISIYDTQNIFKVIYAKYTLVRCWRTFSSKVYLILGFQFKTHGRRHVYFVVVYDVTVWLDILTQKKGISARNWISPSEIWL